MLVIVGFFTFYMAAVVVGAWVSYRVIRGWLALRAGRVVPI
jgi:hypothetical protein